MPRHGVVLTPQGADFSVYSRNASNVELCLYAANAAHEIARLPMERDGEDTWRVTAEAGRLMTSPWSTSMRPVTVAPRRISGGGSERPTLTSKVRVAGSACSATSRWPGASPRRR